LEERLREVTDRMEAEVKEANAGGWLSAVRAWAEKCFLRVEGRLRTALQAFWAPSSPKGAVSRILSILLAPLSVLYALVLRVRRLLYRKGILPKKRVDAPVISIGGVRVGGSGKTPFAQWMARRLSERGRRVVLLTRGYGRSKKHGTILLTHDALDKWNPAECGDEPYLLAQSLPDVPVAVDGDRYRAARLAEETFSPDLFLMDDGFQHLRLARGYDIVLVPEDELLSGMACLPRGPLREPPSALKEADVLVCVSPDGRKERGWWVSDERWWRALERDIPVHSAEVVPAGLHKLEDWRQVDSRGLGGRRITAFCGIARPNVFWETLDGMGLKLALRRDFPDHHPYSEQDHQDLLGLLEVSDFVVTTEKDAVKIRRFRWPEGKVLFLRLDLILEDERTFWARLEERVPLTKRDGGQGEKDL
jgi:tetraacyldisaccharide 4'-kinase